MANQAWQITSKGKISLNDLGPVPMPGPKEALVRIHAAALNYRDVLISEYNPEYPIQAKENLVLGSDGAGIIEASGDGSIWKKGDRVVIHPNSWKTGIDDRSFEIGKTMGGGDVDGTLRRWMVANDDSIFHAPDGISLEEASTIYTAGLTAYRALFHGGRAVGPGMTILTQGTGGVSCYAIQIAHAVGATVIATSSSDEKLEIAKKLGATHLINYMKSTDWASEVLKATDGRGVDIVVDVVGGGPIDQTLKSTSYGGLICVVGVLNKNAAPQIDIAAEVLFGAKTIKGQLGAGSKETAEEMCAFMSRHEIHPAIAETVGFEEVEKGLAAIKKLNGVGKVVVQC